MAIYKRGDIYWYSFQSQGRRIQESSGFKNKKGANEAEAKKRTELRERRAGLTARPLPPKLDGYVKEFLAWSKLQHRKRTFELHEDNCNTLMRHWRGKWLDGITAGMVEDFKLSRIRETRRNAKDGGTVSPATVNRALTTLKLMFNHAAKCGLAVQNPTIGVKLLDEGPGRMRVMTFEEGLAYFGTARQPLRDIARVILDTGLRPDEVYRMEVGNVNFDRSTIFNPHGKTKAARRTITMTEEVWKILKARVIAARGAYVFPSTKNPDRPIGSVRKAHDATVARARITDEFRLYDLRHTYATRAAAAGVDLPTLAALLGHSKITMTMRYVHPAEEHKREAARKLEKFNLAETQKVAEEIKHSLHFPLQ